MSQHLLSRELNSLVKDENESLGEQAGGGDPILHFFEWSIYNSHYCLQLVVLTSSSIQLTASWGSHCCCGPEWQHFGWPEAYQTAAPRGFRVVKEVPGNFAGSGNQTCTAQDPQSKMDVAFIVLVLRTTCLYFKVFILHYCWGFSIPVSKYRSLTFQGKSILI